MSPPLQQPRSSLRRSITAACPACASPPSGTFDGSIVYGMGFDDERDNDEVLECEGITVLIAPLSRDLLNGATLDFVELKPGEFQFIFINPNEAAPPPAETRARGGCGSGGCSSCG